MKLFNQLPRYLAVIVFLMLSPAVLAMDNDLRFTVMMSGIEKGSLVVSPLGPHETKTIYKFEDRGRGPDLTTISRFGTNNVLTGLDVTGVSYSKQEVDEHYSRKGGTAAWRSAPGDGQQANTAASAYYLVHQSNAEDYAALARALKSASNGKLPLLPAGEARVHKLATHTLFYESRETQVSLYQISGIDLQPTSIWLDSSDALFSFGSPWIGVVREGYESALPELQNAEKTALLDAAKEQTNALRHTPYGPVLIRNARVFDPKTRQAQTDISVLIEGDVITAIGPDATVKAPKYAEVIDANGRFLMPGLWDMHVHVLGHEAGILSLLAGITTVRDLGNDPDIIAGFEQYFESGTLAGPRILKAGLLEGRGPYAGPIKLLADSEEEVTAIINNLAQSGYTQVKIYNSFKPELVPFAVKTAHASGLRVSGHVPAGMTMEQAISAGYDEVQHANFWFLNFMPTDIVAKTNTPVRFSAPAERAHALDLSSQEVSEFITLLQQHKTVVDPTLVVFEAMYARQKGVLASWLQPWADRLPASMLRSGLRGGRAKNMEEQETFKASFERMQEMLLKLHKAGIPVVPGTDGSPLQLVRELELYAEAGLSNADILYSATLGAAKVMKMDKQIGSVAVGQQADLILVNGDPLTNISDLRQVDLVLKGGALYKGAALSRAAGLR